ncbi:MAG TPA: hypothetical protein VFQ22_02220, partial [Longimicrobiales bacterium]|nr:hypothetical protein [Longimicrobiales bacterium]
MTVDREALRSWYVEAMGRRIEELREAREGIVVGEERAYDAARAVGQALRGSGATFGFADLSPAAGLVETAPDGALLRRVEGLIEHLHRVRAGEAGPPGLRLEWLVRAAGVRPRGAEECFESVEDAWERLASLQRLDPAELARRAAAEL